MQNRQGQVNGVKRPPECIAGLHQQAIAKLIKINRCSA
jgi:hypothetical protein